MFLRKRLYFFQCFWRMEKHKVNSSSYIAEQKYWISWSSTLERSLAETAILSDGRNEDGPKRYGVLHPTNGLTFVNGVTKSYPQLYQMRQHASPACQFSYSAALRVEHRINLAVMSYLSARKTVSDICRYHHMSRLWNESPSRMSQSDAHAFPDQRAYRSQSYSRKMRRGCGDISRAMQRIGSRSLLLQLKTY